MGKNKKAPDQKKPKKGKGKQRHIGTVGVATPNEDLIERKPISEQFVRWLAAAIGVTLIALIGNEIREYYFGEPKLRYQATLMRVETTPSSSNGTVYAVSRYWDLERLCWMGSSWVSAPSDIVEKIDSTHEVTAYVFVNNYGRVAATDVRIVVRIQPVTFGFRASAAKNLPVSFTTDTTSTDGVFLATIPTLPSNGNALLKFSARTREERPISIVVAELSAKEVPAKNYPPRAKGMTGWKLASMESRLSGDRRGGIELTRLGIQIGCGECVREGKYLITTGIVEEEGTQKSYAGTCESRSLTQVPDLRFFPGDTDTVVVRKGITGLELVLRPGTHPFNQGGVSLP